MNARTPSDQAGDSTFAFNSNAEKMTGPLGEGLVDTHSMGQAFDTRTATEKKLGVPAHEHSGRTDHYSETSATYGDSESFALNRFRIMAENTSDVVCEANLDMIVTWISPSVTTVLGWNDEEIVGSYFADFIMDGDLDVPEDGQLPSVPESTQPQKLEIRVRAKNGEYRWMSSHAQAVCDADGVVTSYVAGLRDIHDEVEARIALKASEARFRLLVENEVDIIILLGPDHKYQWVSPSVKELLGWEPDYLIGRDPSEFVHEEDLARLIKVREHPINGVTGFDSVRYRCTDDTYRWLSGRSREVRDDDGVVTSRVISLRDVHVQVETEHALKESEARYRLLVENESDVVIQTRLDSTVEWISPSVTELTGWTPETILDHNIAEFVVVEDLPAMTSVVDDVINGIPGSFQTRIRTSERGYRWVAARAKPIFTDDGEAAGAVVTLRDVHEEVLARSALAESEERFRLTMESAPIGMALVDLERRFIEVNEAFATITGRTKEWLLAHGVRDVLHQDDDSLDLRLRAEALTPRSEIASRENRILRPDGVVVWVEHAIGLLRDTVGRPVSYVSTYVDVTETKASREQLKYQATHDTLTHLTNRQDFYRRADLLTTHDVRSGDRVGALFIDVDGLKQINDTYGHAVGDEVLIGVAQRLSDAGRADDVVSRLGGDEFVILLPALHSVGDAQAMATKILGLFESPMDVVDRKVDVAVSIGIALAQPGEPSAETLRHADEALYEAKRTGRSRAVTWTPPHA